MSEQTLVPLSQDELKILKEKTQDVLNQAKKNGATSAEVGASCHIGLATTIRMGNVETMSFHRDKGLQVTVYFDQKKGSASTSDTSPQALQETVAAACDIAKYTSADEYAGLADAELMATEFPDLDLEHPWALSPDHAIKLALECEEKARAKDSRLVNSDGVSVSTSHALGIYANSHGFVGESRGTRHGMSCVLIGEEDGNMQRDYWYTSARRAEDLDSIDVVADRAAERTIARLGGQKIPTCKTPVLFSAEIASGLLSSFISAISGGSLYRKASFLLDSLNTTVFSPNVNIHESPYLKRAMGSRAFDSEGVTTHEHDIVRDGVVQSYVLSSYSARKLGMTTTANAGGVHNLVIEPGEHDFEQLLKKMDKGLLVTELMGQGVNGVTGDYSRGAAGFWVENGEIQYPVEEITIAGNLKDMFKQFVAIGNDVDMRGNILTGSILIEEMTVAG